MARAFECPACGAKHRADDLPDEPTFRCESCGRELKVPTPTAAGGRAPVPAPASAPAPVPAPAPAPAPASPRAADSAPVVPPPRRDPGASSAPGVVSVSATVSAVDGNGAEETGDSDRGARGPTALDGSASSERDQTGRVPWLWRLLAWVVAVPLGLVLTAWPAYHLDLIRKDDVLNVFVGSGAGRYVRLIIGTALWALVTALLVQLFVEGGRRLARRRRAKPAEAAAA